MPRLIFIKNILKKANLTFEVEISNILLNLGALGANDLITATLDPPWSNTNAVCYGYIQKSKTCNRDRHWNHQILVTIVCTYCLFYHEELHIHGNISHNINLVCG